MSYSLSLSFSLSLSLIPRSRYAALSYSLSVFLFQVPLPSREVSLHGRFARASRTLCNDDTSPTTLTKNTVTEQRQPFRRDSLSLDAGVTSLCTVCKRSGKKRVGIGRVDLPTKVTLNGAVCHYSSTRTLRNIDKPTPRVRDPRRSPPGIGSSGSSYSETTGQRDTSVSNFQLFEPLLVHACFFKLLLIASNDV